MQISKKSNVVNRVAGNTKIVLGKTVIPTNNYDLSYLKQPKSNPSLSLLVKSFKHDKWKPIPISSLLSYSNFCKQNKYEIMK